MPGRKTKCVVQNVFQEDDQALRTLSLTRLWIQLINRSEKEKERTFPIAEEDSQP